MSDEKRVVEYPALLAAARKFEEEYRREFASPQYDWDPREPVDAAYLALVDALKGVESPSNVARPRGTIVWCPTGCGGSINTGISNACGKCGADLTVTDIPYDHPERCGLRTKGPDSWGCHKRKGHTTGNGGRHCSTHTDCGYRIPDGGICGKPPGHDDNAHEIADDAPVVARPDAKQWNRVLDIALAISKRPEGEPSTEVELALCWAVSTLYHEERAGVPPKMDEQRSPFTMEPHAYEPNWADRVCCKCGQGRSYRLHADNAPKVGDQHG